MSNTFFQRGEKFWGVFSPLAQPLVTGLTDCVVELSTDCKPRPIKIFSSFHVAYNQGRLTFFFLCFIERCKWPLGYRLSLGTFSRSNSSFAFCSPQHHAHIRHKRDYDEQKAAVVV